MTLTQILHKLADAANFPLHELGELHEAIDELDNPAEVPAETPQVPADTPQVPAPAPVTAPEETTPLNVSPGQ